MKTLEWTLNKLGGGQAAGIGLAGITWLVIGGFWELGKYFIK